jgi:pimeloyl-ACP methyl ester carboxylesterase
MNESTHNGCRTRDSLLRAGQEPPLASHLVTPRSLYSHHGIYDGSGRVIHYAGPAHGWRRGPVEEVSLESFAHGRDIRVRHERARFERSAQIEDLYERIEQHIQSLRRLRLDVIARAFHPSTQRRRSVMKTFERLANLVKATMSATAGALGVALIASPVYAVAGDVAGGGGLASTSATPARSRATPQGTALRPFKYRAAQAELDELRRRIVAARLPEKEPVTDHSQGVPLATVQKLAKYWATEYDWRKIEAKLNSYPQFITEIDGLDIHFVHVKSKHPNALPVIVTHGWPGSIIEQLKIVDPLVNPTAYGGTAADAFDVVIPSMPGYGFSGKPTATGWGPERIARAYGVLMQRLGYQRYVAQGGDWGAVIVDLMATQKPPGLLGIHTNMPGVVPPEIDAAAFAGKPAPAGLSAEEKHAYQELAFTYQNVYYAFYMASRPQSLTALSDSPVGLATFMIDHDPRSLALIARAFDGERTGLTRDDVLDNVTLFWLTNTAVSAARLYRENKNSYFAVKNVTLPVAVSVFPDEIESVPRSWAERAYPKLIHFNELDQGGHFAAWEQPELFVKELRAGFKSLR